MYYFVMVFLLIVFDQWTKTLAAKKLKNQGKRYKGGFVLCYIENRGAALGFLKKYPKALMALNSVVLLMILMMYKLAIDHQEVLLYQLSLLLIISGGFGNLIDRFRRGYVIDFLSIKVKKIPYFNYADLYVLSGVVMMIISNIFYDVSI